MIFQTVSCTWFYFQFMVGNSLRGTTKIYFGPIIIQHLLKWLSWFNEKTDICNFTDDNTLFRCAQTIYEKTMTWK